MSRNAVIALAMTWDGVRCPLRILPAKARAFLADNSRAIPAPPRRKLAGLLAEDAVSEIRVCWIPELRGGEDVLSDPFVTPKGKRLGFHAARTVSFGDVLGVVYRRD